jgi:hypothetical protein
MAGASAARSSGAGLSARRDSSARAPPRLTPCEQRRADLALHLACSGDDLAAAEAALGCGANPDCFLGGQAPLHVVWGPGEQVGGECAAAAGCHASWSAGAGHWRSQGDDACAAAGPRLTPIGHARRRPRRR